MGSNFTEQSIQRSARSVSGLHDLKHLTESRTHQSLQLPTQPRVMIMCVKWFRKKCWHWNLDELTVTLLEYPLTQWLTSAWRRCLPGLPRNRSRPPNLIRQLEKAIYQIQRQVTTKMYEAHIFHVLTLERLLRPCRIGCHLRGLWRDSVDCWIICHPLVPHTCEETL